MTRPPEHDAGKHEVLLQQANGTLAPAQVELGRRDWNEARGRQTECRIRLSWAEGEIEEIDWNFFDAFKSIRKQLELLGIRALCYGSSRRVVISGMLMDCCLGLDVYRVDENSRVLEETVSIFDNGDDVELVNVEEQEKFQNDWVKAGIAEVE